MGYQSLEEQTDHLNRLLSDRKQDNVAVKRTQVFDFDELFRAELLPIECTQSKLQMAISSAEAVLDHLRFEDDELKQKCEKLETQLSLKIAEQDAKIINKENAIRLSQSHLKKVKAKLRLYEDLTKTKFCINEKSTTAFIFNPNGIVEQKIATAIVNGNNEIVEKSNNDSEHISEERHKMKFTEKEIEQINQLWDKLKCSDKWNELKEINANSKTDYGLLKERNI